MPFVDLHIHTRHSDGTDPPAQVVQRARQMELSALAITDHDTVGGLEEARAEAQVQGVGFLGGVEISSVFNHKEIHVVGLGIQPDSPILASALDYLREGRRNRAREIVDRLNAAGVPVEWESLCDRAGEEREVMGRMHIARQITALGWAKSVQRAFEKYLNPGKAAFVQKPRIACGEAVELIHGAGGVALLAHPGIGRWRPGMLERILDFPFDGIEAYHAKHSPGRTQFFLELARNRGLLVGGGSDCHGTAKQDPQIGMVQVPVQHYERICQALSGRRNQG